MFTNPIFKMSICKVVKVHRDAVFPSRAHPTDVGYDLSVVAFKQAFGSKVAAHDTGLQLEIPEGYYAEIHGRSSLPKHGLRLANCVGIIDPSYRGNLIIILETIEGSTKPLVYPFRCCQLIFKQIQPVDLVEGKATADFYNTDRGTGGLGSSG
jgi:dUTP pyrophosphatase